MNKFTTYIYILIFTFIIGIILYLLKKRKTLTTKKEYFNNHGNKEIEWSNKYGNKIIEEFNANNQLIKKTYYKSNGLISYIKVYNPQSHHCISLVKYQRNGRTINYIENHNPQTAIIKRTYYSPGGRIEGIYEYNLQTGKKTIVKKKYIKIETIVFICGGVMLSILFFITILSIIRYFSQTDETKTVEITKLEETTKSPQKPALKVKNKTTKERINECGHKVIDEFNENNQLIKSTTFQSDGKTIDYIYEYNPQTGNRIKLIEYRPDGANILIIDEYNPQTGNRIKRTWYNFINNKQQYIYEYDHQTGNRIKCTTYDPTNMTIIEIEEYNPQTGELIKSTKF